MHGAGGGLFLGNVATDGSIEWSDEGVKNTFGISVETLREELVAFWQA